MQAPDALLFAIAQISVSLAGFSGLIAALRATTGEWHPRDIWSLSWMLGSSVGALLLALLPPWLALAGGATDEHVYRVSCAGSAVAIGSFAIAMSLAGRRLTRRGFPRRVPAVPTTLFVLLGGAGLIDALGAAGAWGDRLAFAYVGSLMVLLVAAVLALCVFLILLARTAGSIE
jgi:hypothetical protein